MGDAANVHESGTKVLGDIKTRKEAPAQQCPLCPTADVLCLPGTRLGAAVAPRAFYKLQSSTWFIPRAGRGCSQVKNQLQNISFAAAPPSQCPPADGLV